MKLQQGALRHAQITALCAQTAHPPLRTILTLADLVPRCAGLAIVTLIVVLFVAAWWGPNSPGISLARAGGGLIGWGCLPGITRDWYVSHQQWRADARTILSALQFVLSPDLDRWSLPVVPQPTPFLSAVTNSRMNLTNV